MFYYDSNFRKDFKILKSKMTPTGELSSRKIEPSQIDFNQKSVIILCGNNSKSTKKAEFYSHLCYRWLDLSANYPNIATYSVYYPYFQPLFNEDSNLELDYKGLASEIFGQILNKGNKILSAEEVIQSLSNVIFFGHSAGGYVMDELMKNFKSMLEDRSFTKADIKKIFNNIVFIAYAPYKLVSEPIKAIYVAPIYDSMGSTQLVYKKVLKSKSVMSSNPDILDTPINARTYLNFKKKYESATKGKNILYFANKNLLVATPNLLYSDGIGEDHNFAGAIKYICPNSYQTSAGRLTAQFLSNVFRYCMLNNRKVFNMNDLYELALKTELKNKEKQL